MVLQPHYCRNNNGLGYSPFARHYLGNHYCFLFLQVLRCFSSLGLLSLRNDPYGSGFPIRRSSDQEVIRHLPEAYRSLSRPSSPLRAKAFTVRSYLLFFNLIIIFHGDAKILRLEKMDIVLIFRLICCIFFQYVKER